MSQVHDDDQYTFNASALGLGGVLQQGRRRIVIPSQASVALAPTGGEGWSSIENFASHGISCTHVESRVAGYEARHNFFTTYTDILVTNLSVFDRVNVTLMHLTVASSRDTNSEETLFSMHAMYRGVEVDGVDVFPELDVDLCMSSDYDRLANALPAPRDEAKKKKLAGGLARREPIRSALIKSLQVQPRENGVAVQKLPGNALPVKGLGTVYFGELLVKPGRRRVNLLRFDFERMPEMDHHESVPSEAMAMAVRETGHLGGGGSLTVGSGDGNGAPVWPNG